MFKSYLFILGPILIFSIISNSDMNADLKSVAFVLSILCLAYGVFLSIKHKRKLNNNWYGHENK